MGIGPRQRELASPVRGPLGAGRGLLDPKLGDLLRLGASFPGAYLVRRGVFTPSELPSVLGAERAREGLLRLDPLGLLETKLPADGVSAHAQVAALESSMYMRNQLLRDTDWASMAHSLEVRLPLVDAKLLRTAGPAVFARQTPDKRLLAQSPAKPLPRSITERRKTGFSTPLAAWLLEDERLHSWRTVPALARPGCKWAKRWAHVVAQEFESR
jgi:asparagine synthase (glutamine-hydrolysing)